MTAGRGPGAQFNDALNPADDIRHIADHDHHGLPAVCRPAEVSTAQSTHPEVRHLGIPDRVRFLVGFHAAGVARVSPAGGLEDLRGRRVRRRERVAGELRTDRPKLLDGGALGSPQREEREQRRDDCCERCYLLTTQQPCSDGGGSGRQRHHRRG
jgi:hypothetical protein